MTMWMAAVTGQDGGSEEHSTPQAFQAAQSCHEPLLAQNCCSFCVPARHGPDRTVRRKPHNLANLERSFWLHASLAASTQRGYWGPEFPASPTPTEADIRNAAKLLTGSYAANRLYLVYHHEIPFFDAEQVFRWWRQHCPEKSATRPHARTADVRPAADSRLHVGRTSPTC